MYYYFDHRQNNLTDFLKSNETTETIRSTILNLDDYQQSDFFRLGEINKVQKIFDENYNEIELVPRQSVDTVLDYYNKIFLGVVCGYFPLNLDFDLTDKMIRFLEFQPVREYYKSTYKFFLPQAVVGYCFANQNGATQILEHQNDLTSSFFIDFINLQRSYTYNSKISNFIGLIDDLDNFEIKKNQLLGRLHNTNLLCEIDLDGDEYSEIIGAIQLMDFLNEFHQLIEKSNSFTTIQSTIWHFYGYLLETRADALKSFYSAFLNVYRDTITKSDFSQLKEIGIDDLEPTKEISLNFIDNTFRNLSTLLDAKKYSHPLRILVRKHLSRLGEPILA